MNNISANPSVDSLLRCVKEAKTDSAKLWEYYYWNFRINYPPDSVNAATALYYAGQALSLAEKIKFRKAEGWAYFNIGEIARSQRNYTEALKNYFTVLKISEEINDKDCVREQYFSIGRVYHEIQNYSEALKFHLKSLDMAREDRSPDLENILLATGNVYRKTGNYSDAIKCFYEFIEVHNKRLPELKNGEAIVARPLGETFTDLGNYTEAKKFLFSALQNQLQTNNTRQLCILYKDIGVVYVRQAIESNLAEAKQKYTEALNNFHKSIELGWAINYVETRLDAYHGLTQVYKGLNDYKNELIYLKAYLQLKDSLFNNDLYSGITGIRIQHEVENAQNEEKLRQEKLQAKKQQANNILLMGLVLVTVTFAFLILYFRQRHQKRNAIEKAESLQKMTELELQSLRSQLNPHFMFNSLNSIQTLILREDIDKSHSYLSHFAQLLRMLLENADKQFILLQKEIDFLQLYLSLESLRMPDLQYSISVDPSFDARQVLIPNMILQPYVENAIWHGLSHKATDKRLQIRIFRENGTVNYEIEDNGVGRKKAGELKSIFRKQHQSKGMELISKRIELLNREYSAVIQTEIADVIKNKEVAGTLVSIKVPLTLNPILQN